MFNNSNDSMDFIKLQSMHESQPEKFHSYVIWYHPIAKYRGGSGKAPT